MCEPRRHEHHTHRKLYASNSTEFSARIRPLSCESCLGFSQHDGGDEKDAVPQKEPELSLEARPNPFGNHTEIAYSVPTDGAVSLEITDLAGRLVKSCVNEVRSAGNHAYNLSNADLKPGVYLCVLSTDSGVKAIRLIAQ